MSTITTTDGTQIFYKAWGPRDAQQIVFHHGWPVLVMHGTDDQIVPYADSAPLSVKLYRGGRGGPRQQG